MSFAGGKENAYERVGSVRSAGSSGDGHVLKAYNSNAQHKLPCEKIACYYSQLLKVYVQGDVSSRAGKVVFLSIHDVGTNHNSIIPFVDNDYMKEVKKKSIWLHVCLPGQDDDDELLPDGYEFPSLDGVAHDLIYVLDHFNLKTVIGFGEGAGANVLCRFGLFYPNRVLGLMLIDCTSSTAGVDEYIKLKVFNWKEGGAKLADKVLKYLTYHKAGYAASANWKEHILSENLCKYLDVYIRRTDISKMVAKDLKADTLLVVGSRAPNVGSTYALNRLNPALTTVVVFDAIEDALRDCPKNLTRALILFCKGCGVLLGVPMIGLEKEFYAITQSKMCQSATQQSIARAVLKSEWGLGDILDGEKQYHETA